MQILVGWDDVTELENIGLFMNVDGNVAECTGDLARFEELVARGSWDVVLMALDFPNREESYACFVKVRERMPSTPVIGGSQFGQIPQLARFIAGGLHSYFLRDPQREFMFLLTTLAESAFEAVKAERTRLLVELFREEIDSVRRLQESVIPRDLPKLDDYHLSARYEPSQIRLVDDRPIVMAGGDYYDAFSMRDGTLVFLVGDATGHGIKACMSIMTMHTLIRMAASDQYQDTAAFVGAVNEQIAGNEIVQNEGGFITMMYCALDVRSHTLQWTSAGHPLPMLQNLETNEVVQIGDEDDSELPLGIDTNVTYIAAQAVIPPRSRLLIYTDGLTEALSSEGGHTQFGEQGIIDSLRSSCDLPLEQALEKLFADSTAFTKSLGRHDDTSAVLLERR